MKMLSTLIALMTLMPLSAFADANAAEGERGFRRCTSCHSVELGQRRSGPSLFGIVGAQSGAVEGFRYSNANLNACIIWNETNLMTFLSNPRRFMPGTRMNSPGLRSTQDIEDLIAYLSQQN
ncbi:c-type cytochrome [Cochlodiniinecator piscidefendens]|uniref:c-type cytochrome n=1 Tax=Cochlodiniinecator piscidefendens TaxID=2715756 RepID=UPI00140D4DAF|nr:c-type cytochrome [Cochlodiniinecator piscidefendens]